MFLIFNILLESLLAPTYAFKFLLTTFEARFRKICTRVHIHYNNFFRNSKVTVEPKQRKVLEVKMALFNYITRAKLYAF